MAKEIKIAIEKIKQFRKELDSILSNNENLQIRASNVLQTLENGFKHIIGLPLDEEGFDSGFKPSPITNVLGDDVTRTLPIIVKDIAPTDADKEALRQQALDAYDTFIDRDEKVILESLDEIVIRAVAKRAGMAVTSTEPERVGLEFINEIKSAILAKEEVETAKESALQDDADKEALRQQALDELIALSAESFKVAGKEYTPEQEDDNRRLFADAPIEEIQVATEQIKLEIESSTSNANKMETIPQPKKNNRR
jgi:regulator of replication initiation timing